MNSLKLIIGCLLLTSAFSGCIDSDSGDDIVATVTGCTDAAAGNFNPDATEDAGDCVLPFSTEEITLMLADDSLGDPDLLAAAYDQFGFTLQTSEIDTEMGAMSMTVTELNDNIGGGASVAISVTSGGMTMGFAQKQVGSVVNVESGGQWFLLRDEAVNLSEVGGFLDGMDDMDEEEEDGDEDDFDFQSMDFADSVDSAGIHHLAATNETHDASITMNADGTLASISMNAKDGSESMSVTFIYGADATVTVDETLPRAATPLELEGESADDDGQDEPYWACADGNEIPLSYLNDGYDDCTGGEDEPVDETDGDFTCADGSTIPLLYANDGEADCPDGDDELDDDSQDEPYWTCADGNEIPLAYLNDGDDDCTGGEDEPVDETDGDFTCADGSTIPLLYANDGEADCPDDSDELEYSTGTSSLTYEVPADFIYEVSLSDLQLHAGMSEYSDDEEEDAVFTQITSLDLSSAMETSYTDEDGATWDISYTDVDGDGLLSAGDIMTLSTDAGSDSAEPTLRIYDTWAEGYTDESPALLPGFGLLGLLAVLSFAAVLVRRDP
jgi:hypothetical protein